MTYAGSRQHAPLIHLVAHGQLDRLPIVGSTRTKGIRVQEVQGLPELTLGIAFELLTANGKRGEDVRELDGGAALLRL